MNVLSLFDGMSCGQIALDKIGIKVENYYASEIKKHAIQVTQKNYPSTIQVGDVTKLKGSDLPKIDLFIGGSPCQDFSRANKTKKGLDGDKSGLFWEYVRLLKETKPTYFLLENVKMKKEWQDIISEELGVKPVRINSSLVSGMLRDRFYWTNIPMSQIKPIDINFNGYLYRLGHGYVKDEIKFFQKYPALTAQSPASKYRIVTDLKHSIMALATGDLLSIRRGQKLTRSASPEECEEFQTLPIGYTNCLSKSERFKCIGNGWTVDIVAHIFKGLL